MRSIVGMFSYPVAEGGPSDLRYEGRAVRLDANARTQAAPGQGRGVGRHCAWRGADQKLCRDRLEIGAEMHRTLVDEDRLFGRLDPDIAIHRLVGELRLMGCDD